jgi:predicted CoA-substrate-specific enzyme activase
MKPVLEVPLALSLGIDIGAVSVKIAVLGGADDLEMLRIASAALSGSSIVSLSGLSTDGGIKPGQSPDDGTSPADQVLLLPYTRLLGEPRPLVHRLLTDLTGIIPVEKFQSLTVVGSGAGLLTACLGGQRENEYRTLAIAASRLHPEVKTLFEMGGETAKYLLLDSSGGVTEIRDYSSSGDCAAGTGSFIDQQASRLNFEVEEIGHRAESADRAARIAGRCSVFAKSDMIHAQQKGYDPEEILRGLCDAVSRNFKGNITRGKKVQPPVLFLGGVARNAAVRRSLLEIFALNEDELLAPDNGPWFGAMGAALLGERNREQQVSTARPATDFKLEIHKLLTDKSGEFETQAPLDLTGVDLLRHKASPRSVETLGVDESIYLGVDIGSVSTNFVLIDADDRLIHEIYLRTRGRPVEVVTEGLIEIRDLLAGRGEISGVGTTGSGRELVGQLIGADTINDEITAHKTGASYIASKLTGKEVDTIFEIGGQDSKFISLDSGVVVDFAMNEACAAGTGSFLEEQAERMGISIIGQFADLALSSKAPIRMGERCTVFMERDLNTRLQRGAPVPDLCAGLAYSIVLNYLNRVVGSRHVGDVIYFQGGTAYNDAVAAAFSKVLGKTIIVPPHNGVVGAIGMAILAREKTSAQGSHSNFRGFNVQSIDYSLRKFTCKACSNHCEMEEFTVDGVKTYWGDKCSDRYRKTTRVDLEPVTEDLIALKNRLMDQLHESRSSAGASVRVGLPRAMYYYESYPFWGTWLDQLGVDVVLSERGNRRINQAGQVHTVAEPCYPITVAHGHIHQLVEMETDWILLPNVINAEATEDQMESYLCPWGQTLPFVARSSPAIEPASDRMLIPRIRFQEGEARVKKDLRETAARLGASARDSDRAVTRAFAVQRDFDAQLHAHGQRALETIVSNNREGILLLGRPYNMYDDSINMAIPRKLRENYGVNVIPMDFFDYSGEDTSSLHPNMFWSYGRKILAAANLTTRYPKLHIIYVTNFKCGPDSFIKQFLRKATGQPFLVLQFDDHANDAGVLTRCEAYLDSKGVLRWWSPQASASTV